MCRAGRLHKSKLCRLSTALIYVDGYEVFYQMKICLVKWTESYAQITIYGLHFADSKHALTYHAINNKHKSTIDTPNELQRW